MVLYTLKGITGNEFNEIFNEILEAGEDVFTYIVTKKDEKYRLHTKHGSERKCIGILDPIEINDTLLCEITFDEEDWWKQRTTTSSILISCTIFGIITAFILYLNASPGVFGLSLFFAIVSLMLLFITISYNSLTAYNSSTNKKKVQRAFEGWFKEYL